FLVLVAAGYSHRSKLRYLTCSALAAGLCIYFLPVLKYRGSLRMTVLPAGGGSILIDDQPRGERLLVDASDERGAKMILAPFLHALGINALDSLLLTHASVRHVGGTGVLLKDTPPKKAVTSGLRFRSIPFNAALRELDKNRIPLSLMGENDTVGRWQVIHPAKNSKPGTADSNPLIFRGEHGGLRLLFLSDLGWEGQKELIARHSDELKTDLLIAGMPARGEPLGSELLELTAPKIIILCTSDYPASNRGSRKLRERLESRGIPIYYCDEAKAITVTVKPNQFRLEPMNGESLEWKSEEAPKFRRRNDSATLSITPSVDTEVDE
ncbi:MAG: ComEC family competence protein, partial [Verrucomicrobiales bacterium]|nr:ComEC family competence protein [Verrucomicrobiales bacterium]